MELRFRKYFINYISNHPTLDFQSYKPSLNTVKTEDNLEYGHHQRL